MLINLTPHAVTVYKDGKSAFTVESTGLIRATSIVKDTGTDADGVPVVTVTYGQPDFMPDKIDGTIYIVSSLALAAIKACYPDRIDFVIPDGAVRDDAGKIIGCTRFAR